MGNYSGLFSGLTGYWDGSNSGTTYYDLIGSYNGTISGSPSIVANKFGISKAVQLNSDSKYITISKSAVPSTARTYIFVMKMPSATPINYLTFFDTCHDSSTPVGEVFNINTDGKFNLYCSKGGGSNFNYIANSTYNDGLWKVITYTWDGAIGTGNVKLYVNGVQDATTANATAAASTPAYNIQISSYSGGTNKYYPEPFGSLMIFNVVKTATEVATLSKLLMTKPIQNPHNLRSWWA